MNSCTTVPKDFPRCGACIYWCGEKEVLMDLVQYDVNSKGKCCNTTSPAYGQVLSADNYCFNKKDY